MSGSDGSFWSSLRNKPEQQDIDLRLKRNNHPAVPWSEIRKHLFEAIKQERVDKVNEKHNNSTEDTNEIQPLIIKGAKSWSEVTNEAVKMSQKEYTTGMNQIKINKSTEF